MYTLAYYHHRSVCKNRRHLQYTSYMNMYRYTHMYMHIVERKGHEGIYGREGGNQSSQDDTIHYNSEHHGVSWGAAIMGTVSILLTTQEYINIPAHSLSRYINRVVYEQVYLSMYIHVHVEYYVGKLNRCTCVYIHMYLYSNVCIYMCSCKPSQCVPTDKML